MWWIPASMAVGAIMQGQQAKAQRKAQQQQANISAAQTEYSPWTGITPQQFNPQPITASALGGAVQGGLSGVMQEQAMKQGAADADLTQAQTNYYNSQAAGGGGESAWMQMQQKKPTLMYDDKNQFNFQNYANANYGRR